MTGFFMAFKLSFFIQVSIMQAVHHSLKSIQKQLVNRKETLAVVESVTAGSLQAAFSLAENATEFFQGGLTVYNIGL